MADPFISEIKYTGSGNQDFVEVFVDAGTSVSGLELEIYNPSGTLRSVSGFGTPVNTVNGKDIYIIDSASAVPSGSFVPFNGLHRLGAVALVQNGTVLQFNSFTEGGAVTVVTDPNTPPGSATGTSTVIGTAGAGSSLSGNPTDGYVTTTPPTPGMPCFTEGTLVDTISGPRAIETLKIGDLVLTVDNGPQPIRWIAGRKADLSDPGQSHLAPICIPAHQFGPNNPTCDIWVSPSHRILMQNPDCNMLFGQSQVLSAAKFLKGGSIHQSRNLSDVTYYHMMFDTHQIVETSGMRSESFYPGGAGLDVISADCREELFALFPALRTDFASYGPTARQDLRRHEGLLLAA